MNPLNSHESKRRFNRAMRQKGIPAKACGTCLVVKAHTVFATSNRAPDGKFNQCDPCRSAHRNRTRDRSRAYGKKYYAENAARLRAESAARRDPSINRRNAARWRDENRSKPLDIGDAHLPKSCAPATSGGCGRPLTRGDFYRCRSMADHRSKLCRECEYRRGTNRGYRKACKRVHGAPEHTTCYLCGLPNDENAWVDHLVSQSRADTYTQGDVHAPFNLRWTHPECNMRRGDKLTTAEQFRRLMGWAT